MRALLRSGVQQFQSTPLMRGETPSWRSSTALIPFQSTPLMRGETKLYTGSGRGEEFQSTPLMRGETKNRVLTLDEIRISIHSPHARGDTSAKRFASIRCYFNPLPSCEGRPQQERPPPAGRQFQSTPLMRGETIVASTANWRSRISIHSPHARGDIPASISRLYRITFQSTPLMRGETAAAGANAGG